MDLDVILMSIALYEFQNLKVTTIVQKVNVRRVPINMERVRVIIERPFSPKKNVLLKALCKKVYFYKATPTSIVEDECFVFIKTPKKGFVHISEW
jgi:hypothetical protein